MRNNLLYFSVFLVALTIPFSLFAKSDFNGFYVGGAVGGSFLTAQQQTASQIIVDFPVDTLGNRVRTTVPNSLVANLNDSSTIGTLFAGYGLNINQLYVGAEAFFAFSNYKSNNVGNSVTEQFLQLNNQTYHINNNWEINSTLNNQYGLDIRPGILIKPEMLVYGRVGFARTKVSLSSNLQGTTVYIASGSKSDNDFTLLSTINTYKTGLHVGGGFEYHLNAKYAIRLDYTHATYSNINTTGTLTKPITSSVGTLGFRLNEGTLTATNTATVQSMSCNAVAFGVSYYFG